MQKNNRLGTGFRGLGKRKRSPWVTEAKEWESFLQDHARWKRRKARKYTKTKKSCRLWLADHWKTWKKRVWCDGIKSLMGGPLKRHNKELKSANRSHSVKELVEPLKTNTWWLEGEEGSACLSMEEDTLPLLRYQERYLGRKRDKKY